MDKERSCKRHYYLQGCTTPLAEFGAAQLRKTNGPEEQIQWYQKIAGLIQRESRLFWDAGGKDSYVEDLSTWATRFYLWCCSLNVDELKRFFGVLEQCFKPELYMRQKTTMTAVDITNNYKTIADFQWTRNAHIPFAHYKR